MSLGGIIYVVVLALMVVWFGYACVHDRAEEDEAKKDAYIERRVAEGLDFHDAVIEATRKPWLWDDD